jgi:hypothetical protein
MNFIKNLFNKTIDDEVHRQFKRFSKGEFKNRALVEITNSSNVKIKTSFEFTNDLVRFMASNSEGNIRISGGIITTAKDFSEKTGIEIASMKQFQGVRTYLINSEMNKEIIIDAMKKYPDAIFCLSFSSSYGDLKIKVKAPKSGKSGKDDEAPKADYCVLTTKDKSVLEEFGFDIMASFKKCNISHSFIINELVVPDEYKNDFALARIHARRKGKVIRILKVDDKEIISEAEFEA